ncbi:5,6-dimethylbenzimidazole synthase [Shewanella fidelis]|uniref:5,6-dimethylbenzimidazole synthase n=1 Tax=Shewanella fidelis TaxID=173509 RepID=A0AAW8NSE5_9GAMM|nr:5,6-dimethylbenzimidazole synthase [Shewanella fidelis]MDR8525146.1 5,6-dimethylbenzimidazole synthase [Shewanella fidelis]MDW4811217.1 5,6-dimethylbenzimidazole synthase [Shewanella fidelis]MDW4815004.1 5,6-dimethylbenzimidazole synthase [Shewanella fidelis]MDW4819094.1 5,6-dimethylbenzimidazole synthase [Shewanella fidelis]MDW4823228.1 5,6-dimethylbenzimidazole synthase [Shewanella fidelis]
MLKALIGTEYQWRFFIIFELPLCITYIEICMSHQFTTDDSQLLSDIMRLRRDVRGNHFLPTPVDDSVIDQLLEAALHAPSVGYSQPWQFVVVRDEAIKRQVHQCFTAANTAGKAQFSSEKQQQYSKLKLEGILEAPVNLAVFYQNQAPPVLGQTSMPDMGRFSVVCAIQNLWLMARSLNIGVGWVSIVDPEAVKQAVNAPATSELIGYLCIGYVDEFLDEPELKTAGWAKQKHKQDVVYHNSFNPAE